MPKYVTKEIFEGGIATIRQDFRDILREMRNQFQEVHEDIHGLKQDMNLLKADMVLVKKATLENVDTSQHLLNLTDELRKHGIPIEDSRVFKKT